MKAISHPVRPEPFDRLRTGSLRSGEVEERFYCTKKDE
jgi:hypothetical protein